MKASSAFAGFPEGNADPTPIPAGFFSELLPAIDDVGELRLTLYAFWALARKAPAGRYLRKVELLGDRLLLDSFGGPARENELRLTSALERCVARGTLLQVRPSDEPDGEPLYLLNTPRGRGDLPGGLDRGSHRYRRPEQRAKMELRPGHPGWLAAKRER